jgi:hypothetical protein
MKICRACGKEKIQSLFYSGHAKCKECYCTQVRKYREENIEKVLAYDRQRANLPHRVKARLDYSKTPEGLTVGRKAKRKWAKSNPIKKGAIQLINNAIRDKKIIKPDICEKCLAVTKLHGHHDDYAYPMTVRWLCSKCHSLWHRINGEGKNSGYEVNAESSGGTHRLLSVERVD